jgi:hypothetical protein
MGSKVSNIFPAGFPGELAAEAFRHSNDTAWRPPLAVSVIEWLGTHGFAVLGTEVWLPKGGLIQSVPYFQTVNRRNNEDWSSFVARAAAETNEYLKAFAGEFAKEGDVFINISWVSETEFQT